MEFISEESITMENWSLNDNDTDSPLLFFPYIELNPMKFILSSYIADF